MTLGCVVNFYRETHALPGLLAHTPSVFDETIFVSSPPEGVEDSPSISIVETFGHKVLHHPVSQGYGVLRTWCISQSTCDWVIIMDADERFWSAAPKLEVTGNEKWPDSKAPNVRSTATGEMIDQKASLHQLMERAEREGCLAICLSRRHWITPPGEWERPCQNWHSVPDWQLRMVKNSPYVCYDPEVRMHERLVDTRTWDSPKYINGSLADGPFIDHYSIYYKSLDPEKNKLDAQTYELLQPGCVKDMWLNHQPGVHA